MPVDIKALGKKLSRPARNRTDYVLDAGAMDVKEAERQLYIVRRRIEKAVIRDMISDFYLCSLSNPSIIYKGMFLANRLQLSSRFARPTVCLFLRYLPPALFDQYNADLEAGTAV